MKRSRQSLALGLAALETNTPRVVRTNADPVEFPRRYKRRDDVEVAALVSAALAYGRADIFRQKVAWLLERLGPHPGETVARLDARAVAPLVRGFVYRFNVATDVAVLLLGAGRMLRENGTIEAPLANALAGGASLHAALSLWLGQLRDVPMALLRKLLGPERGLHHLLPSPLGPGAAKRWNMLLRWLVRGPDGVDLGIWRCVKPAQLMIPLDTHVHRLARRIGLTRRTDASWRTAEEVTAKLAQCAPEDPVQYDFALCHHGMSGACGAKLKRSDCQRCPLRGACRTGRLMLTARQSTLARTAAP
ncbi:MAG: TIGR02757 family protein [Myxococcaceae bacterium]